MLADSNPRNRHGSLRKAVKHEGVIGIRAVRKSDGPGGFFYFPHCSLRILATGTCMVCDKICSILVTKADGPQRKNVPSATGRCRLSSASPIRPVSAF